MKIKIADICRLQNLGERGELMDPFTVVLVSITIICLPELIFKRMNIVTGKHFNDFPDKSESVKDSSSRRFSVFQIIWMIFACIVLGCILASATVTLLLFLNTPAGRTISVLAVVGIFFWMKKKGWLPL